jgi:hypothetical protein
MAKQEKTRFTATEYLSMECASDVKHEFAFGEIYAMSGALARHVGIVSNIVGELRNQLRPRPWQIYEYSRNPHGTTTAATSFNSSAAYQHFESTYSSIKLIPMSKGIQCSATELGPCGKPTTYTRLFISSQSAQYSSSMKFTYKSTLTTTNTCQLSFSPQAAFKPAGSRMNRLQG